MWKVAFLCVLISTCAAAAQDPQPRSIEVFPFELEDRSAGAGIIPPDAHDIRYLEEAGTTAKQMLVSSGRFQVVDVQGEPIDKTLAPHGLRNCNGCEVKIAKAHGASLALLGVVTRVNRTEHTMFIRITDVETGKPVAQGFTDLRMGANYAWPRSVKWVMNNRILYSKPQN